MGPGCLPFLTGAGETDWTLSTLQIAAGSLTGPSTWLLVGMALAGTLFRANSLRTRPRLWAFASLADFAQLTEAHLAGDGVWMAMKGKRPDDELQALDPRIDVFHVEQLVVPGLSAERCLVWMRPRR